MIHFECMIYLSQKLFPQNPGEWTPAHSLCDSAPAPGLEGGPSWGTLRPSDFPPKLGRATWSSPGGNTGNLQWECSGPVPEPTRPFNLHSTFQARCCSWGLGGEQETLPPSRKLRDRVGLMSTQKRKPSMTLLQPRQTQRGGPLP